MIIIGAIICPQFLMSSIKDTYFVFFFSNFWGENL
jgi:hypothetical protein